MGEVGNHAEGNTPQKRTDDLEFGVPQVINRRNDGLNQNGRCYSGGVIPYQIDQQEKESSPECELPGNIIKDQSTRCPST